MRGWIACLWLAIMALAAVPAQARALDAASTCAAASSPDEPLAALANSAGRWHCGPGSASLAPERTVLRLSVDPSQERPLWFGTRASMFEAVTLAVVRDGRVIAEARNDAADIQASARGSTILLPLPAYEGRADAVLVAFDKATTRGLFGDAAIYAFDPADNHDATTRLLLAAIVCGMLIMPLAFNAAYYRVLRERFVLWHLVLTLSLLTQCLLNSGIIGNFVPLSLAVHARAGILSFGFGVAAAAGFCAAFIEPGKMHPMLRRGLYWAACGVAGLTLIQALLPDFMREIRTPIYYASFAPVLLLFLVAMADAARRRSRAVRYQLIGWAPFIFVGLVRIVTMLVPAMPQDEALPLFHIAMVVESIATSLGVADRFMMIKRQRDRAVTRATSLARLSQRDDLTGLYNRRALDGPLGDFAAQRFTGFALFDLDSFKRVNDTHGHASGDAVLRTVATVLDGHDNAVAMRMGGEEFLLLLRGDRVQERVERLREAIPVRIAREVTELETLVTASAGLIEAAPGADVGSNFVALYRAADDLLYEAKHNGRNLLAARTLPAASSVMQVAGAVAA